MTWLMCAMKGHPIGREQILRRPMDLRPGAINVFRWGRHFCGRCEAGRVSIGTVEELTAGRYGVAPAISSGELAQHQADNDERRRALEDEERKS